MRIKYKKAKPKEEKLIRANHQIRVPEVFLIDENGEKVGVVSIEQALQMAEDANSDLVEVNPKVSPPVCKIVELGQLRYEQEKKAHREKMAQKKVDTKTIRLSVRISAHDFEFRLDQAAKFLQGDNKLKVEAFLRGREKQHVDKGKEIIDKFIASLRERADLSLEVEQPLTRQAGGFTIILVNKK